jgi:hypothetical protein
MGHPEQPSATTDDQKPTATVEQKPICDARPQVAMTAAHSTHVDILVASELLLQHPELPSELASTCG